MPAGQLDGGHIARAVLGPKANGISLTVIVLLEYMAFYGIPGFAPPYLGWAVYAVLIFFLGTSHPPPSEELSSLGNSRMAVGIATGLILILTFIPSPLVFGESQFDLDIVEDQNNFNPIFGESNSTYIVITNKGKSEGWDNLTLNVENLDNYTIKLEVNYVNVSSLGQFNSSFEEFRDYVYWDASKYNLTLNLTSGSYANLTIEFIPTEEPVIGKQSVDLTVKSRTERVYTRTFVLVTEEDN